MVTLTQEQLESMRKAIRMISNRTHITISELNTYLIAGKMPDNVYNALIQAFGVKDIKDVSTSRVALTVNKVSSIYEAIITAKEAEQKPQMHTLTEDQKKGVETSIENLNHYLTELQLLRAEVDKKSKSATGVDIQNYAEQKSSLTRSIKATVKAKAILQHITLTGEVAEDMYNWLFVLSARKGAKLEQLDDAFNQFVDAGDKSALPTGNAAHKLVKEFNRMAEKGLISASPKKQAPQPQTTPNDGVTSQPQKPTTDDDGDNGTYTRPVDTETTVEPAQKPQETTSTQQQTNVDENETEAKKPLDPSDIQDAYNRGVKEAGNNEQSNLDNTETRNTSTTSQASTASTGKNTVNYKSVKVSRWTRFRNWIGKHWLLLGTLVAAGALITTALMGPGLATAVVVGRAALYNILTLGTIVVAANTFKYFFFRRHRQAGIDQAHLLRREAKVDKKLLSINRTRAKIKDLETKLESYMTNPTHNAESIKSVCKELSKYNKKIKDETTFVCRELEGTANERGFLKNVGKVLRVVTGKAPLVYYQERHNKHMDILQEKSNNKKYSELRLNGDIYDEMFNWHIVRRAIMEETKSSNLTTDSHIKLIEELQAKSDTSSTAKTILDGVKKVLQDKKKDYQDVRETVKNVDPCAAEFGMAAKDLYLHGYNVPIERDKKPHNVTIQTNADRNLPNNQGYKGNTTVIVDQYGNNKRNGEPINRTCYGNRENVQKIITDQSKDEGMGR